MKRIVALIASPRKGGNVDTLTNAMLAVAGEYGAETRKIFLTDKALKPCTQCESCHVRGAAGCAIDDDFPEILAELAKADAIVLSTPVWWSTMHASLKLVIDRCYSLLDENWCNFALAGKDLVLVTSQTQPDLARYGEAMAKEFAVYQEWLKIRLVDHIAVSAETRGEIAGNKAAMAKAREIGRAIAL